MASSAVFAVLAGGGEPKAEAPAPNAAAAGRLPNTGDDVAAGATPPAMVRSANGTAFEAMPPLWEATALLGGDEEKKSAVRLARGGGAGDESAASRAAEAAAA